MSMYSEFSISGCHEAFVSLNLSVRWIVKIFENFPMKIFQLQTAIGKFSSGGPRASADPRNRWSPTASAQEPGGFVSVIGAKHCEPLTKTNRKCNFSKPFVSLCFLLRFLFLFRRGVNAKHKQRGLINAGGY